MQINFANEPENGRDLWIGLMTGTSLDGIDGALVQFDTSGPSVIGTAALAFPAALRQDLLSLQVQGHDEIHRAAIASNTLADVYATVVEALLSQSRTPRHCIFGIGAHGQTIRHRPDLQYTVQLNAPARLAELTGIDVYADFRSRDIAAGGQGAPLAPAFHAEVFQHTSIHRWVVNLGGIANVSYLPPSIEASKPMGYDTGPANLLMDQWVQDHFGMPFDRDGDLARQGEVISALLTKMLADPFFAEAPPKSTGRDYFNSDWLHQFDLEPHTKRDVLATLGFLTAKTVVNAIHQSCSKPGEIYLCGGGALNSHLFQLIQGLTPNHTLHTTAALGIEPQWVECVAFAWLARQCAAKTPVKSAWHTGARNNRTLGAHWPA